MTLLEFISSETDNLANFLNYWREQSEANPQDFPKEMEEVDWIDQYLSYTNIS